MQSSLQNITKIPDLRKRLLFALMMIVVYRLGVFIPTPGVNTLELSRILASHTEVIGIFNLISGGALEKFSIFALGIMPYISASIILQLLTVVVPSLEKLSKEDGGRKKISEYTRYLALALAFFQSIGITYGLKTQGVLMPGVGGMSFYLLSAFTLVSGTAFIMWLGEQITERGIGNGVSLIIFSGIVARIPEALRNAMKTNSTFGGFGGLLIIVVFVLLLISVIVFFERAQRRIPIHYAKRVVGRKIFAAQSTHLPLKINVAGVIPPIFASSIIYFPSMFAQFSNNEWLTKIAASLNTGWLYVYVELFLIIFFSYFYAAVNFNSTDVSENIRKHSGFVPGVRPGKPTAGFIDYVLTRITLGGALYLSGICLLPSLFIKLGVEPTLAHTFGGTSVLIVVGVAMDTLSQIESHLLTHNYEGFLGKKMGRFKGRRA